MMSQPIPGGLCPWRVVNAPCSLTYDNFRAVDKPETLSQFVPPSPFGNLLVTEVQGRRTHLPVGLSPLLYKFHPRIFPRLGFPWSEWMTTPYNFELGLLPERRMDWRTLATSYGLEILLILLLLFAGFLFPDEIHLRQKYNVTELVPRPEMREKLPKLHKAPQHALVAKLRAPVFVPTAKLFVPKDLRTRKKKDKEEEKAPKLEDKFTAPQLQQASLPPRLVYTGSFGSSAPATVNAPVQQVQTGGFGDPNGLKGQGKEDAHLVATNWARLIFPKGRATAMAPAARKAIKGTIASVGFGNGIAQGDGRRQPGNGADGGLQRTGTLARRREDRSAGDGPGDDASRNRLQADAALHRRSSPAQAGG